MNVENFKKVLAQIEAHPETWDQTHWHCGTKHCFAGHAQNLARGIVWTGRTFGDARNYLGLTDNEAGYLFNIWRTLRDFKVFLARKESGLS